MGDFDEIMMFPLTDIDDDNNTSLLGRLGARSSSSSSSDENERDELEDDHLFKPIMSLRQRRHSRLTGLNMARLNINLANNKRQAELKPSKPSKPEEKRYGGICQGMSPKVRSNWMRALKKVRAVVDPWIKYHIERLDTEIAVRHRYSALKKKWVTDDVKVKMESEPFNHGAMRSCFRLKKLSSFTSHKDWKHAMNYVAKLYMEEVDRDVYFEDVRLQMDAKLWGEEYNRHNPPKKVDIFQMSVLEFKNRPGSPLYHLEHFIEGNYIKYNSNSGFVEENLRFTPQAFSHFTFERSGHELIVVDIQGVGELWTDPQVHTASGTGYGDGNLGTRGMALFFHSHICNSICEKLGFAKFDLATKELSEQRDFIQNHAHAPNMAMTIVRGCEEPVISASPQERGDLMSFLARSRKRTTSSCSTVSFPDSNEPLSPIDDEVDGFLHGRISNGGDTEDEPMSPDEIPSPRMRNPRIRFLSETESDDSSSTLTDSFRCGTPDLEQSEETDEERIRFQLMVKASHRPSCIAHEINYRNLQHLNKTNETTNDDSVLGQIHHDLAKYHELGRFTPNHERDMQAALFHEELAAKLGVVEAILTMARLYLNMQRDVLVDFDVEDTPTKVDKGNDYMMQAAESGDRSAMIFMADAFYTGNGLGMRNQDLGEAMKWYEEAVKSSESDESGDFDATMDTPVYTLQAKMADMYMGGGVNLEKDPSSAGDLYNEAAEGAMGAMKGRLANKYYALAEEAYGMIEE